MLNNVLVVLYPAFIIIYYIFIFLNGVIMYDDGDNYCMANIQVYNVFIKNVNELFLVEIKLYLNTFFTV